MARPHQPAALGRPATDDASEPPAGGQPARSGGEKVQNRTAGFVEVFGQASVRHREVARAEKMSHRH